MKTFRMRASAGSTLLTEPKLKRDKEAGVLAKTIQSYLDTWIKEQLYGRKVEFSNRYTDKGNAVEGDSLRWVAEKAGLGMLLETNTQYYEDDHFTGTPDIVLGDMVVDLKNSWSFDTFPLFMEKIPMSYEIQLQIYMHLTGKKKAKLVYCLMNTPDSIVDKEIYYGSKKIVDATPAEMEAFEAEVRAFHNYDNVPDNLRFKVFESEYVPEVIKVLQDKVERCRGYIKERLENL